MNRDNRFKWPEEREGIPPMMVTLPLASLEHVMECTTDVADSTHRRKTMHMGLRTHTCMHHQTSALHSSIAEVSRPRVTSSLHLVACDGLKSTPESAAARFSEEELILPPPSS